MEARPGVRWVRPIGAGIGPAWRGRMREGLIRFMYGRFVSANAGLGPRECCALKVSSAYLRASAYLPTDFDENCTRRA